MNKKILNLVLIVFVLFLVSACTPSNKSAIYDGSGDMISKEEIKNNSSDSLMEEAFDSNNEEDWRYYIKDSKNIRFKFHKDWYFSRNSTVETELGFELFVGFASDPKVLEEKPPYPVEFSIMSLAQKDEYVSLRKYVVGIEMEGKYYTFATDEERYRELINKMLENLEFTGEKAIYSDENISFVYPRKWGEPDVQEGPLEVFSEVLGQAMADWVIIPGLKDGDIPAMKISSYEVQNYDEFKQRTEGLDGVELVEEKEVNGKKVIIYTEDHILNAVVFGEGKMINIYSLESVYFYEILKSLKF